jgi:hypothetical protein
LKNQKYIRFHYLKRNRRQIILQGHYLKGIEVLFAIGLIYHYRVTLLPKSNLQHILYYLSYLLNLKEIGPEKIRSKFYLTSSTFVESDTTDVESAVGAVAVSTCAAVESVASFVADPEPQAVNVNATPIAKINVIFLIYCKYTKF